MSDLLKKETPLVTVGIPVFNDEKYVSAAIKDILAQTYSNLEIIISDNCSVDGTEAICRDFIEKDSRLIYFRQESNIGPHASFTFLMNRARGKYFMWAPSDDRWHPEFIESLIKPLELDAEASVAFCTYCEIDEEGEQLPGHYRFDFGGTSALCRITKFHLELSPRRDAFFYGLFRRSKVVKMNFIKWWWFNKNIHMNNAHPPLSCILATGNYHLVESDVPLWFNRVHSKSNPRHSAQLSSWPHLFSYLAFYLRKINQLYETERAIINGSGSIVTGLLIFPVLITRFLFDCLAETHRITLGLIRRLKKSIQGIK